MKTAFHQYTVHPFSVIFMVMILMLFCNTDCTAQKNAIRFQLDNDWFTDKYYTAGAELTYHRLMTQAPLSKKEYSLDKSMSWSARYGFKIFTPNVYDRRSRNAFSTNRPFAGYQYIALGVQKISTENKFQSYNLLLGQVGPQTGMEAVQRVAHKLAGWDPLEGWENQIANESVVDIQYQWVKEWRIEPTIGMSVLNSFQFGTSYNYLQTGVNFRIGTFNHLNSSNWLMPKLSRTTPSEKRKEAFMIFGIRAKYVISNIFLEGSLFEYSSPVTVVPRRIPVEGDLGLMINSNKTTVALIGVFQTREFVDGKGHFYLNFNIARSF